MLARPGLNQGCPRLLDSTTLWVCYLMCYHIPHCVCYLMCYHIPHCVYYLPAKRETFEGEVSEYTWLWISVHVWLLYNHTDQCFLKHLSKMSVIVIGQAFTQCVHLKELYKSYIIVKSSVGLVSSLGSPRRETINQRGANTQNKPKQPKQKKANTQNKPKQPKLKKANTQNKPK